MKATFADTQHESLVSHVISTWRAGAIPDARAVLNEHPELWNDKELVLDLAAEEYSLRRKGGEAITPSRYCEKFPAVKNSLMRLMLIDEFMSRSPVVQRVVDESLWPTVGQEFLGYKIVRQLGRGAFARVFLAQELALGNRRVVLKVAQFAGREAEILGKLNHPHVAPVHSVQQHPELCLTAVCMPYQGEATLSHVLDVAFARGTPPKTSEPILDAARLSPKARALADPVPPELRRASYVDGIAYIGMQIANALEYTHERGILHRDLKPSNVLIRPNGEPVVLDFNLSTDAELDLVRAGGTLPYMAPEQLYDVFLEPTEKQPPHDPRTDIFSLGAILYQLLGGRLPFREPEGEGVDALVAQMLKNQCIKPVPLSELNPDVDGPLSGLVQRCLEIEPDRRPASAREVAQQLARQFTRPRRAWFWLRRHRAQSGTAALILLGMLGAAGWHVATLPPQEVREFRRGVASLELGNAPEALQLLQRTAEKRPESPDVLFHLGRAHLLAENWDQAARCFEKAYAQHRTPVILAWIAYCRSLQGAHFAAIFEYTRAREAGYDAAWLHNNLGHAYLVSDIPHRALPALQQAIQRDPQLVAAHSNLLVLALKYPKLLPSEQACAAARHAIHVAPDEARFHFVLARLLADLPAADLLPEQRAALVTPHVQTALRLGLSKDEFGADPSFAAALGQDGLAAALAHAQPKPSPPEAQRVAAPSELPVPVSPDFAIATPPSDARRAAVLAGYTPPR